MGVAVWFIVDADKDVFETGVAELEGLEGDLRIRYPDITGDGALELDHITVTGLVVRVLWMLPPL